MNDPMLPLPGMSPAGGKTVVVKFDGGLLSSDGGVVILRQVEQRLHITERMAACIKDPRAPDQITHTLADIMGFRMLMIATGYVLAGAGAFFSIKGMVVLFPGSPLSVVGMAMAIEAAKLVTAG